MGNLVDVAFLRGQADKCRRLAKGASDAYTIAALRNMADDYERKAAALEKQAESGSTLTEPVAAAGGSSGRLAQP